MAVTIICDDCRKDITGDETICRQCVEEKGQEISELQDLLADAKSERDDYASQLEDFKKEKGE